MRDLLKISKKSSNKEIKDYCRVRYKTLLLEGMDSGRACKIIESELIEHKLKTNLSTIYRWKNSENWDLQIKLAATDEIEGKVNEDLSRMYKASVDLFFLAAQELTNTVIKMSPKDQISILKITSDTITKIAGLNEKTQVEVSGEVKQNIVVEKCYAGVPEEEEND